MRPSAAILLILVMLVSQTQSASAAELCKALKAFEDTPLAANAAGEKMPRSVELFWQGPWGIENIGYECRHDGDSARKKLCAVLIEHMPQEFRTNLIFGILRCYGYSFPRFAAYNWDRWDSKIELNSREDHRFRLDVNMYLSDGSRDAIGLVSLPRDSYRLGPEEGWLPSLKKSLPKPDNSAVD